MHVYSIVVPPHLFADMPQSDQGEASVGEPPLPSQTGGNQDLLLGIEGGVGVRDGGGSVVSAGVTSVGVDVSGADCGGAITCQGTSGLTEDRLTSACETSSPAVESRFQEVLSLATQMLKDKYSIHQTTIQVESAQSKEDACDGCNTELPPPEWWLFCCNLGGHHHH